MVATTLEPLRARPLDAVDPDSLARLTVAELDAIFSELEPAGLVQLQGQKRGRVLAVAGLDWVPGVARAAALRVVNELPIWRGKTFEGTFGANAWLLSGGKLQFARYLVREAAALDGSGIVVRLDYDVAANPKALRGIVGELRQLGPGLFLARMQYVWGQRVVKILYFTLES